MQLSVSHVAQFAVCRAIVAGNLTQGNVENATFIPESKWKEASRPTTELTFTKLVAEAQSDSSSS